MPPVGKLELAHSIQPAVRKRTSADEVIEMCEAGRYREAEERLKDLDPNEHPLVFGMVEVARGNQEAAKDYLTRAPDHPKKGPQLALAYWYGGETKEAWDILKSLPESFDRLLCEAVFASTPEKALRSLDKASRYQVAPGREARLHNERAHRLREQKYLDRAIQEFEAALYYFEEAQSDWFPYALSNSARVYSEYGEYGTAHEHVDRAIRMLKDDPSHLAKAYDQKALIYLDEGQPEDAQTYAVRAIETIGRTDKKAWLAEFLVTHARSLAGVALYVGALMELDRAEAIGNFLSNDDVLIAVFTEKARIGRMLYTDSEIGQVEAALRSSTGVRDAARKLHLESHQILMRLMKKYGISY